MRSRILRALRLTWADDEKFQLVMGMGCQLPVGIPNRLLAPCRSLLKKAQGRGHGTQQWSPVGRTAGGCAALPLTAREGNLAL